MNKNIIKDIPSFCENQQITSGTIIIPAEELADISERDCRFNEAPITIHFEFQGSRSIDGSLFLKGNWQASLNLNCSFCSQNMDRSFHQEYRRLQLIDEHQNSLDHEGDCQECRFDNFDFKEWLFSEVMLALPIAPRHEPSCINLEEISPFVQKKEIDKTFLEMLIDNQHHR
jgi:uncharacterized metal-binding protein YceD (DUF177 family)